MSQVGLQLYSCVFFLVLCTAATAGAQTTRQNMSPTPTTPCTTSTGLYCEIYGSGDPILFVHGLGASLYTWRFMVAPLQTNYQVILIDLKGFGKSPKPHDNSYSIQDQVELLYQFIQEKNLTNLTLVGNSYGGGVSLLLSLKLIEKDPGRLTKLILLDSAGYKKPIPSYVKLLRCSVLGWLALRIVSNKSLAHRILKLSYFNPDLITEPQIAAYAAPLGMKGAKRALQKVAQQAIPKDIDKLIAKYPTIKVPALILWGDHDKVIPIDTGNKLKAALPCSKLITIPKTGHVPQEESPNATIPLIQDFLQNPIPCP